MLLTMGMDEGLFIKASKPLVTMLREGHRDYIIGDAVLRGWIPSSSRPLSPIDLWNFFWKSVGIYMELSSSSMLKQPDYKKPKKPHPAAEGHTKDALAEPYRAAKNDSMPERGREIVCELLGHGIPVPSNIHNSMLPVIGMEDSVFVKNSIAFLRSLRLGHGEYMMKEAVRRGWIPGGQQLKPGELWDLCTKYYQCRHEIFPNGIKVKKVDIRMPAQEVAAVTDHPSGSTEEGPAQPSPGEEALSDMKGQGSETQPISTQPKASTPQGEETQVPSKKLAHSSSLKLLAPPFFPPRKFATPSSPDTQPSTSEPWGVPSDLKLNEAEKKELSTKVNLTKVGYLESKMMESKEDEKVVEEEKRAEQEISKTMEPGETELAWNLEEHERQKQQMPTKTKRMSVDQAREPSRQEGCPLHPAADGYGREDPAKAYHPQPNDPLPVRAREAVCELLYFKIPVTNSLHNDALRDLGIGEEEFGYAARPLLMMLREHGVRDYVMGEGIARGWIPQAQQLGPKEIWNLFSKSKELRSGLSSTLPISLARDGTSEPSFGQKKERRRMTQETSNDEEVDQIRLVFLSEVEPEQEDEPELKEGEIAWLKEQERQRTRGRGGKLHPAEEGYAGDEEAKAYFPQDSDPLPTRAREVICELMGFRLSVPCDIHIPIVDTDEEGAFVKKALGLVKLLRRGGREDLLKEGLKRRWFTAGQDIGPGELWNLCVRSWDPRFLDLMERRLKSREERKKRRALNGSRPGSASSYASSVASARSFGAWGRDGVNGVNPLLGVKSNVPN